MHLKSLKIYCDTVSLRSFSRAADENGVSQSNASQVVHSLEERLGVELIDRSTRPFRLTPAGEKYYEGCRGIVRRYDDLEREVQALHGRVEAQLAVGAIYSVGLADMSHYLDEFRESWPGAEVKIEYWRPDKVYHAVETEEVDLGIVSYPHKTRRLGFEPWRDEPLVLVCPPDHPLASPDEVELEVLEGQAFVALELGLPVRDKLDRLLAKHKIEVEIVHEFDNIETIKRAVESGAGVSLLPAPTVAREVASGTLRATPLADRSIVRPLGILFRRDRNLSGVAKAFIGLLKSHASDIDGPQPTHSEGAGRHRVTA